LDTTSYLDGVRTDLGEVRVAYDGLKNKNYADVEPFDHVQTAIIDNLEKIDGSMATARAVTGLRAAYNKLAGSITNYETRIKRLEARRQNTTELRAILSDAKSNLAEIKPFLSQKIDSGAIEVIMEKLRSIYELTEQLNDLLQINVKSALENELLRKAKPDETIQQLKVVQVENSLLRAESISQYYRAPAVGYGSTLVSGIKIYRKAQ
jgi:DNA repair exonuclease SbcCD ATPase subunit